MMSFEGSILCINSIAIWVIITKIILNMKKSNQTSANLSPDDLGREAMVEESREAKTKNPVMAPMNLLLKSLISMNRVRYTRNQRIKVCKNVVINIVVQILLS